MNVLGFLRLFNYLKSCFLGLFLLFFAQKMVFVAVVLLKKRQMLFY